MVPLNKLFFGELIMSKEFIFKKNILGGFDRQQVIDCLSNLQAKSSDQHTRSEIEKTNQHINEYLKKVDEKNKQIEELKTRLKEINNYKNSPDNNIFKAIETADKIVACAKEEVSNQIKIANNTASENSEKFAQLLLRIDTLKAEITQIGAKADNISSKLSIIETDEAEDIKKDSADIYQETQDDETVKIDSDSSFEMFEETDNIAFNENESSFENEFNPDNSIDNFFAELEKLTGNENFYDNGPSIDEAFDRSKKILPDTDETKDDAFDDMLKNIFHESSDKQ